jgi:uncharacterized membrane protein YgdD (TMEM256/DUF423 family)
MALGCLYGALAVAMSAVAAHALPATVAPRSVASIQSAIQMQGWHAIALVLTALWMLRAPPASLSLATLAGTAFALGVLLFSGSIYAMTLAGIRLGPTAPAGGLLLIVGWLLLGASALAAGRTP